MHRSRCQTIRSVLLVSAAAVLSHAQTFTTLASFTSAAGASPINRTGYSLVQGPDSNFYAWRHANRALQLHRSG